MLSQTCAFPLLTISLLLFTLAFNLRAFAIANRNEVQERIVVVTVNGSDSWEPYVLFRPSLSELGDGQAWTITINLPALINHIYPGETIYGGLVEVSEKKPQNAVRAIIADILDPNNELEFTFKMLANDPSELQWKISLDTYNY